ncbi:MAG: polysaccharide biosynthesis protein [Ponticaulis sp.]|nr:polysaccharide biosynthesis protein [Ponticaulis sp.]
MLAFKHFIAVVFSVCSLAACETGQLSTEPTNSDGTVAQVREVGDYRLGTGDQLRVIVFGEEELSGEFVVDGSGSISLPLVGEVAARGKTVREFQRSVEAALSEGYLNDPRVSAEVLNYRPFYILGEVETSGEYPYSDGLTVLNAVATAGGFTYRANTRFVYIKRSGAANEVQYPLTATTPVQPGDTIRISERLF